MNHTDIDAPPAVVRISGKAGNHESRSVPSDPPAVRPAPGRTWGIFSYTRPTIGRSGVPELRPTGGGAGYPWRVARANAEFQAVILAERYAEHDGDTR